MNCQKSGLDTVGSSISIVDLLRNDDASIDDWSSILRSSIYRVFGGGGQGGGGGQEGHEGGGEDGQQPEPDDPTERYRL